MKYNFCYYSLGYRFLKNNRINLFYIYYMEIVTTTPFDIIEFVVIPKTTQNTVKIIQFYITQRFNEVTVFYPN